MHFQIFVPNAYGRDALACVGLAHLAEGSTYLDLQNGPAGDGVLFSWPEAGGPVDYQPGEQIWRPAREFSGWVAERYYVGLPIHSRPTALDLTRRKLHQGLAVRLSGEDWIIPAAGKLSRLESHRDFWERAQAWHGVLMAAGPRGVSLDDSCWRYAFDALALNYRLTPEVEHALGLLSRETVLDIILASLQGFTVLNLEAAIESAA